VSAPALSAQTASSATQSDPDHGRALLQIWLSPAFPVGGFAYSHGLEKAVELGWIKDRVTLEAWLDDLLAFGSLHNDLILLAAAWRATHDGDDLGLAEVSALAMALQPSAERRLEASQQGRSFLQHVAAAWPLSTLELTAEHRPVAYPVAVGHASARHSIAIEATLAAFAVGFVSALTSAAIRLSVIGQTDSQRIMAALLGRLHSAARTAAASIVDDLGGAAWRSDIASMQHETQTTRLFRS
jgi:urease accessory protein